VPLKRHLVLPASHLTRAAFTFLYRRIDREFGSFFRDIEGKSKGLRLLAGCHLSRSCGGTVLLGQDFGRSPLSTAFAELKSGLSDGFSRVTSTR
jgi:hypothetical protein